MADANIPAGGLAYTSYNEKLTEEELMTFSDLLFRLVRWSGGGIYGNLEMLNAETKETMLIHIDAHDSVLCEMMHLDRIDKQVGEAK